MTPSYTIKHRGVPVGNIDLPSSRERVAVAVAPLPAYDAIRQLVRSASRALSSVALGASSAPDLPPMASRSALARAAELGRSLELYDAAGALVPTDFIDLTDWPGGNPEIAAIVGLRDSHSRVQARVEPAPSADSGAEPPRANREL